VPPPTAELSSIASLLEQITARVTVMAESASASHEAELASELFAIERALAGARRRVDKLAHPRR
jgi:hypothetical protein